MTVASLLREQIVKAKVLMHADGPILGCQLLTKCDYVQCKYILN